MKKRTLKILALILAVVLTLGLLWVGESLFGNPITRHLVQKAARERLEEVYPDRDFILGDAGYSFKDGGYYVHVNSPSSPDSSFSLAFTHWGRFRWDSYEDRVVHRENTALRVDMEYRRLAPQVLSQLDCYDPEGIQYATLEFDRREYLESTQWADSAPYTMALEDLELDRIYDVGALGAQCGTVIFYVDTEDISAEHAARLMLELREVCDQSGLGFRGLDLVLESSADQLNVEAFPYEDIYEEGLEERIREAHTRLEQKYAELDQQKAAGQ